MKKKLIIVCASIFLTAAWTSEIQDSAVTYKTSITGVIAFKPEVLLNVTEHIKVPAMNYDHPLTRGNNITFKIGADITPISLEGRYDIIWTPIAFLQLYTGSSIGSGWTIKQLYGLAGNTRASDGTSQKEPFNFSRAYYSAYFGGAIQFDLAAVIPHDWLHIVCKIDQFASYKGVSGLDVFHSWVYQSDSGENRNGWRYEGSYVLGYQMPLPLDMIAVRITTEKRYFKVPANTDKSLWGEDRYIVTFGPLFNFKINDMFGIMLAAQWQTKHKFLTGERIFYQDRHIDTTKSDHVIFKRVAAIFTVTIE